MRFDWPDVWWVLPAALAALVVLRFLRARRREVQAGSLLLWRRVAARETAPKKPRFVPDRSFWLQAAALGLLALALCGPLLDLFAPPGRHVTVILDNGPAARARKPGGEAVWADVRAAARVFLESLHPRDRVSIATSSPLPARDGPAFTPAEALARLDALGPALSGPPAEAVWLHALDAARGPDAERAVVVFSPRSTPATATAWPAWVVAAPAEALGNVAITGLGSAALPDGTAGGAVEVLVRVQNFAAEPASGKLRAKLDGQALPEQAVALPAQGVRAYTFVVPRPLAPVQVVFESDAAHDALPEDNAVVAAPRESRTPRVRFHGAAPHLEALFRLSGEAVIVEEGDREPANLDVFVETIPGDLGEGVHAALLVAPPAAFEVFEVGSKSLSNVEARLSGADHPVTRGLAQRAGGLGLPILRARELRPLGDWTPLLVAPDGRVLFAAFRLARARPAYVLAFLPGDGWPSERKLEPPAFAAMLLRMLREATRTGEPFAAAQAGLAEQRAGKPLPLDWQPSLSADGAMGEGLLDAEASNLAAALGKPSGEAAPPILTGALAQPLVLWWLFVLGALVLLVWEALAEPIGLRSAKTASIPKPVQAPSAERISV